MEATDGMNEANPVGLATIASPTGFFSRPIYDKFVANLLSLVTLAFFGHRQPGRGSGLVGRTRRAGTPSVGRSNPNPNPEPGWSVGLATGFQPGSGFRAGRWGSGLVEPHRTKPPLASTIGVRYGEDIVFRYRRF